MNRNLGRFLFVSFAAAVLVSILYTAGHVIFDEQPLSNRIVGPLGDEKLVDRAAYSLGNAKINGYRFRSYDSDPTEWVARSNTPSVYDEKSIFSKSYPSARLADSGRFKTIWLETPQYLEWQILEGVRIEDLRLRAARCGLIETMDITDSEVCELLERAWIPDNAWQTFKSIEGLVSLSLTLPNQPTSETFYSGLKGVLTGNQSLTTVAIVTPTLDVCRLFISDEWQLLQVRLPVVQMPADLRRSQAEGSLLRKYSGSEIQKLINYQANNCTGN